MPVLVTGVATACLFNICSIFIRIIPVCPKRAVGRREEWATPRNVA